MKIIVAGDYCPHGRMLQSNTYLDAIAPTIQSADYAFANLECAICDTESSPIAKIGPNLRADAHHLDILHQAGFNGVTLANNHFADYGEKGYQQSIAELQKRNMLYVGAGKNQAEAQQILYINHPDGTIAILNACEHEFTIADINSPGCHHYDPISLYYQILEARQKAQYILVIIHGGTEHVSTPSPRMQKEYRFLIDAGADLVINHHQHRYLGYEEYHNKRIYYGLGNFCFDWETNTNQLFHPWNMGFLVDIEIRNGQIMSSIIPYQQNANQVGVFLLQDEQIEKFNNYILHLNEILQNPILSNTVYNDEIDAKSAQFELLSQNYKTKIGVALYRRGILPRIVSKKYVLNLLNAIRCESHKDRFISYLQNYLKEHSII
ncbi:MAG: CapA family protein [Paludibacteraceae bacterium]|nr:CapA family protein [Paludibacteraceae bacterium]